MSECLGGLLLAALAFAAVVLIVVIHTQPKDGE